MQVAKGLFTVVLAVVAGLGAAAGTEGERSGMAPAPIASGFLEVPGPSLREPCNSRCENPCDGNGGEHRAVGTGSLNTRNPHPDCKPFSDCVGHPSCQISSLNVDEALRLSEILTRVAEGQSQAIRQLGEEFGAITTFNAERNALQVEGCEGGSVAVHIPLTDQARLEWLALADGDRRGQ